MIYITDSNLENMNKEYFKILNKEVFDFLESKGYEVERNHKGAKRIFNELKAKGKKIIIETTDRRLIYKNKTYTCMFNLHIRIKNI